MIPIAMPIAQIAPITESMFVLSFSVIVAMMSAKIAKIYLHQKVAQARRKMQALCRHTRRVRCLSDESHLIITTSEPIMPHIMLTKMPQ